MNEVARPEHCRFQFSLKRLLLWTVVVALGCGMLSTVQAESLDWLVLSPWLVTVFVVRWAFGGKWAAIVSVMIGVLLCGLVGCIGSAQAIGGSIVTIGYYTVRGGLNGSPIGFVLFLLVEAACRTVNWFDSIGQSGE